METYPKDWFKNRRPKRGYTKRLNQFYIDKATGHKWYAWAFWNDKKYRMVDQDPSVGGAAAIRVITWHRLIKEYEFANPCKNIAI